MGECFLYGASSSPNSINLRVISGTTKPTTTRENTIWVKTDVSATGCLIASELPESPSAGLVMIYNNESGVEIKIGKKNEVVLHLSTCRIYTGSDWEYVDGYVYTNGGWVCFATELVPAEYTAVEYIEGTGTQYIKTGITNVVHSYGFELDYIMKASLANDTTKDFGSPFGAKKSDYNSYNMNTYNGGILKFGYSVSVSLNGYLKRLERQTIKKHLNTVTLPGGTEKTITPTSSNMANLGDIQMYLFAINTSIAGSNPSSTCKYQLFGFKMYNEEDELISDLIPCYRKTDNVAGLWDRVRRVFLTNAGKGTFLVGEEL